MPRYCLRFFLAMIVPLIRGLVEVFVPLLPLNWGSEVVSGPPGVWWWLPWGPGRSLEYNAFFVTNFHGCSSLWKVLSNYKVSGEAERVSFAFCNELRVTWCLTFVSWNMAAGGLSGLPLFKSSYFFPFRTRTQDEWSLFPSSTLVFRISFCTMYILRSS
jgi:hypothetical protein